MRLVEENRKLKVLREIEKYNGGARRRLGTFTGSPVDQLAR
jgi:hypothetical protein